MEQTIPDSIETVILEQGWVVRGRMDSVLATPIAYTVGLCLMDLPELAIFGVPLQEAQAALSTLASLLAKRQLLCDSFDDEPLYIEFNDRAIVLRNQPGFAASRLADDLVIFSIAHQKPLRTVQLVYSDQNGRFPWEAGCDAVFRYTQNLLEKPDVIH